MLSAWEDYMAAAKIILVLETPKLSNEELTANI
jgi:hypothetical protein